MKMKASLMSGFLAAGLILIQCGDANMANAQSDAKPNAAAVEANQSTAQKVGTLERSFTVGSASFTFENGRYYGNSGCNELNGTYAMIDANTVQIQPMAMTRKLCPGEDVMQQEANFAQNFPGTYTIKNEGATIILQNDQRSWVLASTVN